MGWYFGPQNIRVLTVALRNRISELGQHEQLFGLMVGLYRVSWNQEASLSTPNRAATDEVTKPKNKIT